MMGLLLLIDKDGRLGYMSEEVAHEHVGRLRAAVRWSLGNHRMVISCRCHSGGVDATGHRWHLLEWSSCVQQFAVCMGSMLSAAGLVLMLARTAARVLRQILICLGELLMIVDFES